MSHPLITLLLAAVVGSAFCQDSPREKQPPEPSPDAAKPAGYQWSKQALEVIDLTNKNQFDKAFATAKAAAKEGNVDCIFLLGRLTENGLGVKKDEVEAVRRYIEAAENGHLEAKYNWARCLAEGIGVKVDLEKSDFLLQQAAEAGFAGAQVRMGQLELEAVRRPRNDVAAREWFEKAAAQGDAEALFRTALCYQNGWGGVEKDLTKALENLLKAANGGHIAALNQVGIYYQHGIGLRQDKVAAAGWFRYAAEYGFPAALANLGQCYEFGQGVKPDIAVAVKYYQEAAQKGDSAGHLNLGRCLAEGKGIAADVVLAYAHYVRSADLGMDAATQLRDELKAKLSAEQIKAAEKQAEEWANPSKPR